MFKRGLIAAAAAASLVAAPAVAQSSASKLSVASSVRSGAAVEGNELAGGALIGVLVFVAAVAIIYFVAEENDESESA
ncbi:hypothetical protein [Sphingomonas sp.]|jgi:hypothetical protein|uniref:hypothetical protein n=1 Tax=Sphingomonas sp. TaxID=28214 RepID=UPI002DF33C3E|nr:hypothetical protein [Sphingomonas sp.]